MDLCSIVDSLVHRVLSRGVTWAGAVSWNLMELWPRENLTHVLCMFSCIESLCSIVWNMVLLINQTSKTNRWMSLHWNHYFLIIFFIRMFNVQWLLWSWAIAANSTISVLQILYYVIKIMFKKARIVSNRVVVVKSSKFMCSIRKSVTIFLLILI